MNRRMVSPLALSRLARQSVALSYITKWRNFQILLGHLARLPNVSH